MRDVTPRTDFVVGSKIRLTLYLTDLAGAAVTGAGGNLTIAVRKPDGTMASPAPTVSEPDSDGNYQADYATADVGIHIASWTHSGEKIQEDYFVTVTKRGVVTTIVTNGLLGIRKRFIEATGAHHLVEDVVDYRDNGADWYINRGQEYLEKRLGGDLTEVEVSASVAQGEYYVDLTGVRAVLDVRMYSTTDDEGTYYLDKMNFRELIELLGDEDQLSEVDEGYPIAYAVTRRRFANESPLTADIVKGVRIWFLAPADGAYTLKAVVHRTADALSADADVSYWTEQEPQALVLAAVMQLERHYNNFERIRATKIEIDDELQLLDNDATAQEMADTYIKDDWWNEQRIS